MDDQQLIYSSPARVAWTLEQAKSLGIDRIKVSVVWYLVAPQPTSAQRPKFNAADPAAYPPGAWTRYDQIVSAARSLGLRVYFQLVPPAPTWAVARGRATQGYSWSHNPSASEFGQFVHAVGRRYSGSYIPPSTDGRAGSLPRVDYWAIWNEPNEGPWLNPQFRTTGHGRHRHLLYVAPSLYRGLVDAAWKALQSTGHAGDTVLIGETSSYGWIFPLPFVQHLYCVSRRNQPLTGRRAVQVGCPRSGNRARFVARHPGLFDASGYAHHPYSFDVPPNTVFPNPNLITLANLGRLERTLDVIFGRYGRHPPGGLAMYLTEWGYKSNPPNPYVKTSLSQQAAWLNQGEYMTWKDPRVRALSQFLLVDDTPHAGKRVGSREYWATFQTGLMYVNNGLKPAYSAFRIPIWVPDPRHGSGVLVWGQLRPADHTSAAYGMLEYQSGCQGAWTPLQEIQTDSPEGFLETRVAIPAATCVRLSWLDPSTGVTYSSRTVKIA